MGIEIWWNTWWPIFGAVTAWILIGYGVCRIFGSMARFGQGEDQPE